MPYKKRGWIEVDYKTKAMFQAYKESLPKEKPWDAFMNEVFVMISKDLDDEDKEIIDETYENLLKSKDFS